MAIVEIDGVFMGAEIKSTTYDNVTKTSLNVDIYQPKSPLNEKTVLVKTDDVSLLNKLSGEYDFGSSIKIKASVNAYKNKAYYKLLEVVS